ncbi:MAG: META domain-containing protein [Spirochaetaceae bacterium]|nr:META domain-containing protein [Spirochaetaceae bacterium]
MKSQWISRLALILLVFTLPGCRTVEEPAPPAVVESPEQTPEPESITEPDPLDIDWPGTVWIIPDSPEQTQKQFPGYKGFFLGRDNRLLLINQDSAAGNLWSMEGNRITLSLLEGTTELPMKGTFVVFPGRESSSGTETGEVHSIRLVPEADLSAEGITFERAEVNVDLVENHWIPQRLDGGEKVIWPVNREIHLMLLPDISGMGVLGFGGENRFHGSVQLGEESFVLGPLATTRRYGPASDFENLYVQRISESSRFVQVGDDLYLYSDTSPVATFRVRLFD